MTGASNLQTIPGNVVVNGTMTVVGGILNPGMDRIVTQNAETVGSIATITADVGAAQSDIQTFSDIFDSMDSDAIISPPEKNLLATLWSPVDGDGSTTGQYWSSRASAIALAIDVSLLDAAYTALKTYLLTTPGPLKPATWDANVAVGTGAIGALFGAFSREYTQTIVNITFQQAYISCTTIDCGMWANGVTPDAFPDLGMGMWDGTWIPTMVYDCGMLMG